jgi:hypothetical protein
MLHISRTFFAYALALEQLVCQKMLHGLAADPIVPAFIEFLQIGGTGRLMNHFFGFVRKSSHDFEQFPFPTDRGIHVDTGQQYSQTFVAALADFFAQAAEIVK